MSRNQIYKLLALKLVHWCLRFLKKNSWTICLWFITFGVILPSFSQRWLFSPYFRSSKKHENTAAMKILYDLNKKGFEDSRVYLSTLNPSVNKALHSRQDNSTGVKMMALIITKRRVVRACETNSSLSFDCESHYLQQTVAALDKEAKFYKEKIPGATFVPTVICNVDPFWTEFADFLMVKDLFPVIYRHLEKTNLTATSTTFSTRLQGTSDYVFCLESLLNLTQLYLPPPSYALIMEDDGLPFPDFFHNVFYILENRVDKYVLHGEQMNGPDWSFVKLYYPEMWAGYGTDSSTLIEMAQILLIGALLGIFIRLFCHQERSNSFKSLLICGLLSASYCFLLARIITRQTLLEVLRLHPSFLKVSRGAPGCCTQAAVYPTKSLAQLIDHLKSPNCIYCREGVDIALDDYSDNLRHLVRYLVEPNLVKHIGYHTTLPDAEKDALLMMFYEILYNYYN